MNPHFIFNSLNSIQLLIAKSDPKNAMYFLSTFAALVRRILDNSVKSEVYLSEEIEVVKEYIELEKLRKKDQLEYKIIVATNVLLDDITLPPMLIQPIVENAIKHGLEPLIDTPGMLTVHIESDGKFLFITVTDNGVGMQKVPASTKKPHGYQLVAKRISLWNRMPRSQCIDIKSRPVIDGTSIRLIIAIKAPQRA
jgi:LytS/YehU family sensor histidine kinase